MEFDIIRITFDVLQNLRPVLDGLAILYIPIGLLLLFLGWKFYNLFVALPGAVLGGVIGFTTSQGEELVPQLIAVVIAMFIGGGIASFFHFMTIWGIFALIGAFLIAGIWGDLFSISPPSEVLVFGSIFIGIIGSVIYGRFLGVVAALIGSAMIGSRLGYGGVFILVVAAVGFWVQYHLARAWGDDVFRRQSVRKQRQAERHTREKRKLEPYETSSGSYVVEDMSFDPNAEMQVIED